MKLLLDTHIWIKCVMTHGSLSRAVTRLVSNPNNEIFVSPISGLEFLSICQRKRLRSIRDPIAWLTQATREPFREAPLTFEIAVECGRINLPHDDPADRILVATARVLGCKLATDDRLIAESGLVEVVEGG